MPNFPAAPELARQALHGYLLNVADAIQNVLLPELAGGSAARAGECVTILTRAVQELNAAGNAADASPLQATQWKAAAMQEGERFDAGEAAQQALRSKLVAAAGGGSRSFDRDKFERYMQGHALGGPALRITQAKQLAGGRSKQTILISQEGGRQLPAELVVRQDWSSAVTGTSVVSEFKLLRRVWEAGLKVPQPLLLEESAEVLGSPFLVVTRMSGGPQGDIFNPPPSEKLALQLAEQLARLHTLPVAEFAALGVPCEAYSKEQLRTGLQGFRGLQAQLGTPTQTIAIAIAWLDANIDRVDGAQALLHNDLGCHNFLIEGETLTAILDWELAHIGNPAADLGYIRSWIEKMTSWDTFMARYRSAGGPAISEATLDFYTIWCGVRLYCLLLQARAGVAMGMVKDTEITYASAHFLPMLVQRISMELRGVLAKPAS